MDTLIADIHDFWFGKLDDNGLSAPAHHALWFTASDATDRTCRERFGQLVQEALANGLQEWDQSDPGLVARVLLLDQRGTGRSTPLTLRAN